MTVKKTLYALRVEWHWWLINRYHRRMGFWIEKGEPFTSPRLCKLESLAFKHGLKANSCSKRYKAIL